MALVLSRKKGEGIILGDQVVRIFIADIKGDRVRIGIEAPDVVPVHREEIYEAMKRNGDGSLIKRKRQERGEAAG